MIFFDKTLQKIIYPIHEDNLRFWIFEFEGFFQYRSKDKPIHYYYPTMNLFNISPHSLNQTHHWSIISEQQHEHHEGTRPVSRCHTLLYAKRLIPILDMKMWD